MFRLRHLYGNRRFRVFLPALIGAIIWATLPAYSLSNITGLMSDELRLYAALTGAPINGVTPGGTAEYRYEYGDSDNRRRLKANFSNINLPVGTVLTVAVNGGTVTQFAVNQFQGGGIDLDTNDGQNVPIINSGSTFL